MGPAQKLRTSIDSMPIEAKQAMLEGIQKNGRIILGAYADRRGGVCPMLAAHRCGHRRSFNNFVQAWDQYTGATTRPRAASQRELRTLVTMLETSIALQQTDLDLKAAASEHRTRRASRKPAEAVERPRLRRDVAEKRVSEGRVSDTRLSDEARAREQRALEARERRVLEARERRRRETEGQRLGEGQEERLHESREKRHLVDTGEKSRVRELSARPGWAWLRVFRDHDEYEAAMERLREEELRAAVRAERELDLERV